MPAQRILTRSTLSHPRFQQVFFGAAFVATTLVYFVAAWQSRFNLSNVDGISYISIAKQYAAGLFDTAVNGYWSPLVSWLMAPLIAGGIDPLLSFMYVNALAATVGTIAAVLFVRRFTNRAFWPAFIVLVVCFALYVSQAPTITPDAWVVTWATLFAWTLVEVDRRLRPGTVKQQILGGLAIGAMGVFGYVAKQYVIPVFIVSVIIWFAVRIVLDARENAPVPREQRFKRWFAAPVAVFVAAAIVAAPWVATLSLKYEEPTVGSSFSVNIGMKFDPKTGEKIARDPLELVAPPNEYAVAYGEDRSVEGADGKSFKSDAPLYQRIKYYLIERVAVFPYYLQKIGSFAPFAVIIYAGFLLALLFRWVDIRKHREAVSVLILGLVYFAGYAAITQTSSNGGNARYYWPALTLSTIVFALLLPVLWRTLFADMTKWRRWLAIALIALVPFAAISQNVFGFPWLFSTVRASNGTSFILAAPAAPDPYNFSVKLREDGVIPERSKIVGTNYRMTLRLAFYLEAQAYGRSGHMFDISNPEFQDVLRENDIDYFLRFTPVGEEKPDVSDSTNLVKSYVETLSCSDDRGTEPVPCNIEVLELKEK